MLANEENTTSNISSETKCIQLILEEFFATDFVWSYYNLGQALEELENWNEALKAYQSALKLQPNSLDIASKIYAIKYKLDSNKDKYIKFYKTSI